MKSHTRQTGYFSSKRAVAALIERRLAPMSSAQSHLSPLIHQRRCDTPARLRSDPSNSSNRGAKAADTATGRRTETTAGKQVVHSHISRMHSMHSMSDMSDTSGTSRLRSRGTIVAAVLGFRDTTPTRTVARGKRSTFFCEWVLQFSCLPAHKCWTHHMPSPGVRFFIFSNRL